MGFELKLLQSEAKKIEFNQQYNSEILYENVKDQELIDSNKQENQSQFLENFENKYNQIINDLDMNGVLKRFLKKVITSIIKGCQQNDENISIFFEIRKFLNQQNEKQKKKDSFAYQDLLSFLDELYLIIVDCQFTNKLSPSNNIVQDSQEINNNQQQSQDTDEGIRPNLPRSSQMNIYFNRLVQRQLLIRMLTTLQQQEDI